MADQDQFEFLSVFIKAWNETINKGKCTPEYGPADLYSSIGPVNDWTIPDSVATEER